jgi:hypothetical protein
MDALLSLEESALADLVRGTLYAWIQITHIASFSILVGMIALIDLRLLGYFSRLPLMELLSGPLRLAHFSFGMVMVSGCLLFTAQPTVLVNNPAFQLKLLLILAAGVNATVLHQLLLRGVKTQEQIYQHKALVRSIALISLGLWFTILACGRMIAYV